MGSNVVHFEITTADEKAAQTFYGELFGWTFTDAMEGYGLVNTNGGAGINGGIGRPEEGGPNMVTFYVAVPDLDATLAKAEGLGAKTFVPPMHVTDGVDIALFADPTGNMIGLLKDVPAPEGMEMGPSKGSGNPVVHFEVLGGTDGKALQDFYRTLFGWHVSADNPMGYGEVDTHGEGIGGGIAAHEGGHHVTFYVQVPDLQASLDKAGALGDWCFSRPPSDA